MADDSSEPIASAADAQERDLFTIILRPGLWRGVEVAVEPPIAAQSLRSFRDRDAALVYANQLAAVTGWPVQDHAGG